MCGRTCLTLLIPEIKYACKYLNTKSSNDDQDSIKTPEWRSEFNCGKTYQPFHNIAPTDITPVLVSSDHFNEVENDKSISSNRVLVPMMWGMIPFWHKGDFKKHGLTTNNCRLEHMLESKLYRRPFRKGQRCVIICEGFYEWQTTKSVKPSERSAYFLYMPQKHGIKIYDKSTWTKNDNSINLLKLAGLFDIWKDENGDQIFSYSVITFESCEWISWLHHRMPAILDTDQKVADWIDFKRVSDEEAISVLKPSQQLSWHQVSNFVNNSRNKGDQCNKPIKEVKLLLKKGNNAESSIMKSWLIRKRKDVENVLATESDSEDEENNRNDKRQKISDSPKL